MRRIMLMSSNRAERGLLEPVMRELQLREDVLAVWCDLDANDPEFTNNQLGKYADLLVKFKPDIVMVPCDRWEMVYVAAIAFHNNFVVAHFHAGNIGLGHPDEMNRVAISAFSHILLCNTEQDKQNLVATGTEEWRCHVVGSTAFDYMKLDDSTNPPVEYDLVLLHPDPLSKEATENDLKETLEQIRKNPSRAVVWIGPNSDHNSEVIMDFLNNVRDIYGFFPTTLLLSTRPQGVSRNVFLGLLRYCRRFIGNSSAMCYEAPYFKKETIRIGNRNCDRETIKPVPGGSLKIAEILATTPINEKLLRKKVIIG